MAYQPYLTIKDLWNKRDKSQILLMTISALAPAIIYTIGRIVWDILNYHRLLFVTGNVFVLAVIIQTAVLMYMGYWVLKVLRDEK